MELYKRILRDPSNKISGIPAYLVKSSVLYSLKNPEVIPKYEDISLPHSNQVYFIDCDSDKNTIHSCVIHLVDQPATADLNSLILASAYFTFKQNPEGNPLKISFSMKQDTDGEMCKVDIIQSNFLDMIFNRKLKEVEYQILQFLYNKVLLMNLAFSSKEIIQGSETRTIKASEEKGKKAYKEVEFRHLSLRSSVSDSPPTTKRNIQWDFSWRVRGHWRYYKDPKMGLNREGERTETGRTWVSEYIKNEGKEMDSKPKILRP